MQKGIWNIKRNIKENKEILRNEKGILRKTKRLLCYIIILFITCYGHVTNYFLNFFKIQKSSLNFILNFNVSVRNYYIDKLNNDNYW